MLHYQEKKKIYDKLYSTIWASNKGEFRNKLLDYLCSQSTVKEELINYLIKNRKNYVLIHSILLTLSEYNDYYGEENGDQDFSKGLDYAFLIHKQNIDYFLIKTEEEFENFKSLLQERELFENSRAEFLGETKKFNLDDLITSKEDCFESLTDEEKKLLEILLKAEYEKNILDFCSTLEKLKNSFKISNNKFTKFTKWLETGLKSKITKDKITLYKKRVELAELLPNFKDKLLDIDILNDSKIRLLYKSKNDKESLIKEIKKILKEKK